MALNAGVKMSSVNVEKNPKTPRKLALRRVLLMKGGPDRSEPIRDLARELNDLGVNVKVINQISKLNVPAWLYFAWRSEVVVFVRYHNGDGTFLRRQLYRARMLDCAVVRWWVGSDVLYSSKSDKTVRVAKAIDEFIDLNIAVSPHLVTELREIGIEAEYVPSFCKINSDLNDTPSSLPRGVLTYLPTERRTFYGEDMVIAAIEANPDLQFFIIADESHSLNHYPNVTSLGWVEDMREVWAQIGMLLRVTKHDGMPRMVLEALARRRYVIYSEIFEGCWFARSTEQVLQHLETFRTLEKPNNTGTAVIDSSINAATEYADKLAKLLKSPS
ncbi:hypothetical protein Q6D67_01790 [Haliea sp. E1-2-M8]|uniref:hypothetical protein n=1 Tax=Haliea sp. E1-2-M8 TaxID=3064706 RepID=UPI0027217DDC|nr:hypothetical protein [Haliea sp. E1-2-M8]MDO8860416.1 hypothetical protein [Haliea sp. E1-2-M8]